jgi:dihydrofolate synthase/folylpolyglutamate synthase
MTLTYDEALDYLYCLINYEVQRPERYAPDVVSLDRPRALLAALGNPQDAYPIVHLTGTKGKGSVSAICASVFQAAGLHTGLYSSPHLQDFRERFQINGQLIDPQTLAAIVTRIRPIVEQNPGLTWFEVTTAIAFLYFAQAGVDVAVIEVGLGGRLDATNIVTAPLVSTITSLSYDHTHLLGSTLAEIAFEKAGIIKAGVPVVSAPQHPEALAVLERIAAERSAPLTLIGRDLAFTAGLGDEYGQTFTANLPGQVPQRFWTPLIGEHQALNAAVAIGTLHRVRDAGFTVDDRAILTGLRQVNWPGRLEVVRRAPWVVLDVAHNGASAERLRDALHKVFLRQAGGRLILIFGAFKDKDVPAMFQALLPETAHLITMQAINPRAFSTDELLTLAHQAGYTGPADSCPAAVDALARAQALASPKDVICVTGSLSVVGEMRTVLGLTPAHAVYLDQEAVQVLQNTPISGD